ncbi:putative ATP-dependent endonuclease of OLD family [Bradyrhizobium japonicum]
MAPRVKVVSHGETTDLRIVRVEIDNFRGIKRLDWQPRPGINCLIGSGDSGKTTILDAIELVFASRNGVMFDDADFYDVDPKKNPISITVTLADIPSEFLRNDRYGNYTRGWHGETQTLEDEPDEARGFQPALSVRLTVDQTLEAEWGIFNRRLEKEGKRLPSLSYNDRQEVMPSRLGPYADHHLGWGRLSVLNKITEDAKGSRALLAEAGRIARAEFSKESKALFAEVIKQAKCAAQALGVAVTDDLQAMLDIQAVGLSGRGISLHEKNLPLRQLGLGSSRLFVAALQDQARVNASIALIDEVEHGLEPHRIARVLRQLKAPKKDGSIKAQVFLTTHSPVVLCDLAVSQLHVVRRDKITGDVTALSAEPQFKSLDCHAVSRTTPEAFLVPTVLVCEGKTEVGLMRGLDHYWSDTGKSPFATLGIVAVSGGGVDRAPMVAGYFRSLGYRVGLLLDTDREPDDKTILAELKTAGVSIFRWKDKHATEDHLFRDLPTPAVKKLLKSMISFEAEEQSFIDRFNRRLPERKIKSVGELEQLLDDAKVREVLGGLAKVRDKLDKDGKPDPRERGVFKDIAASEWVGEQLVGPNLNTMTGDFPQIIGKIRTWADQ